MLLKAEFVFAFFALLLNSSSAQLMNAKLFKKMQFNANGWENYIYKTVQGEVLSPGLS